jgi:hypothetical protein
MYANIKEVVEKEFGKPGTVEVSRFLAALHDFCDLRPHDSIR